MLITKASEWICEEVSNTEKKQSKQKEHTGKKTNGGILVGLEAFKDSGSVWSQVLAVSLTVPAFTCRHHKNTTRTERLMDGEGLGETG